VDFKDEEYGLTVDRISCQIRHAVCQFNYVREGLQGELLRICQRVQVVR
jgi:hypothetical protein